MFEQIGAKVAYYRRLTGFSQAELAEKIHVNKSVLSRIERGKYNDNIPLILLLDIADIMQVDVATFITFNDLKEGFGIRKETNNSFCIFKAFLFISLKMICLK